MKPMIQAHLVERDQFGFWTHPNYPDLADNCSSNEAQETLRRLGLELQTVFMESDAPLRLCTIGPTIQRVDPNATRRLRLVRAIDPRYR